VTTLTAEEFCRDVTFTFGVPLIIIDLFENLTGTKLLPKLKESMQPHTQVTQVEQYDEELNLLRLNIQEDFYQQHLLPLFNQLGQFDFRDFKQVSPQNIEMFQYLTLQSIQRNFHKAF
jgi:hypothetical protein